MKQIEPFELGEMGVKVPLLIKTTDSAGRFGETEIESEIPGVGISVQQAIRSSPTILLPNYTGQPRGE